MLFDQKLVVNILGNIVNYKEDKVLEASTLN